MGYYTKYDIKANGEDFDINEVKNKLEKISDYFFEIKDKNSFTPGEIKWYNYKEDMLELSKLYPNLKFIVFGEGDEPEDKWKHYFSNGINEKVFKENGIYRKFKTELKPYESQVLWKSKGKTPAGDSFFTVKEARGYYVYGERGGADSIAFILYNKVVDKYALIYESKPPMDERFDKEVRMTTAFGGSIDMNCSKEEIVQTEVAEEAGYKVPLSRIDFVGKTLVSTQMSQMCYLYFVDVTGIEKTLEAEYEKEQSKEQNQKDPNEFAGNEVRWLTKSEVMENQEWKSIYILAMKTIQK